MRAARLIGCGAITAGLLAGAVAASPSPVSPAAGSSVTTSHPTFRWKLGPGEVAESVSISSSPALGSTGDFAQLADADILTADATSWTPSKAVPAGKYWWHVASHDSRVGATPGHLFSPAVPFTINAAITLQSITFKTAGRQFLATVSLLANVKNVNVAEKLFNGKKSIGTHRSVTDNFIIDQPTLDQSTWTVPPGIKHGTTLRLVVTLTVKGSATKVTKSKTLRAP